MAADFAADKFDSSDKSRYVLEGNAKVVRLDQQIQADKLTYDNDSTAYLASGNVRYQDRGTLLSATQAKGTTTPSAALLTNVHYQLLASRGNGVAETAAMTDANRYTVTRASYTTCNLDDPEWYITAKDISIDQDAGLGHAHDMVMHYKGVPIFWLPWARFPTDDRRESGFLYPSFFQSTNSGFNLTLPYYLNLAPNYDATLFPRIVGDRGFMAGGEFRYWTDSSKGTVEAFYLPDDRKADRDRSYFHIQDVTGISANWALIANVSHVSDDRYFEDFGNSLINSATSLLPSSAYITGRGSWWTASLGGDRYQITDPTLSNDFDPYQRLPRLTFEGEHALLGNLVGGVKSEFVDFHKDNALDGQRLDLYPYLAFPLEGAAWFVRPELGYRYTSYDLDRDSDKSPTRGVPIGSLDAGLVFERDTSYFGHGFLQTLEPRLYYLRVPYRNQDDLPVFDTQEINFDFPQLFRPNRFTGADRQEDANNLTVALTSRLLESDSGVERLSASFGQIRYFDDQRVQLPGAPLTDYSGSNYVGELDLRLSDRWSLRLADQWNPNTDQTDLSTIGVQNRFGDDGVVNFSYRYRRNFLEQVDISTMIPLNAAWRLIARYDYSLKDRKVLESFFGFEHDSCCVAWRVLARRYVRNVEGQANSALYFELEFKGLGSVGQRTDDFLRRAILGYR